MIPSGFEPETYILEGCYSNPIELRNLVLIYYKYNTKFLVFKIFLAEVMGADPTRRCLTDLSR